MIDNTIIINAFQSVAAPILKEALWLFWTLAGISLVWSICKAFQQPESIFYELTKFIFVIGFYSWLLLNATLFGQDIIMSLSQLGTTSGSTNLGQLSVSLFSAITGGISVLATVANPATAIGLVIIGVAAAMAGFSIVIYQWLIIIQGYILTYIGPIAVGASSFEGTRFVAHNYFKAATATGLKLMTINVMCSVAGKIIQGLITYVTTSGDNVTAKMACSVNCLGMVLGIAALALFTPGFIASLVFGHSSATAALGAIAGIGMAAARSTESALKGIGQGISEISKNTTPKESSPSGGGSSIEDQRRISDNKARAAIESTFGKDA